MKLKPRRISASQGFTMIELVVVITIIAILAAVALPRFVEMQRDARMAKANAIFGSIRSAAALARSRCELDITGNFTGAYVCDHAAGYVNMDGVAVTMLNKYPTADASGILAAAAINATADGLTISSAGGSGSGATIAFDVVGAVTPSTCRVSYTAAAVGSAPVMTVVVTGC
jgi:MSHA pilin protein MshA